VFLDLIASSFRVRDEIETSKPDPFICYLMEPSHMAKEAAARSIADLVEDGMVVGLGTGTTAARAIAHLGRRILDEGLSIAGIPTSHQSMLLAVKHRIPLTTLYEHKVVDIALDGADQVDAHLNLIKGGGGAHTREKIVARSAKRFCVAVDASKLAPRLNLPVPLEVLPVACPLVQNEVNRMGATAKLRQSEKNSVSVTDQGNLILDADFGFVKNPEKLAKELSAITGVVEHGIFVEVSEVHVARLAGKAASVEVLTK
jgi:ribose 5-phosphate isomerase A